jgi:hypothetical protein
MAMSGNNSEKVADPSRFLNLYNRYKTANGHFIAVINGPTEDHNPTGAELLYSLGLIRELLALSEALTFVNDLAAKSPWLAEDAEKLLREDFETRISLQMTPSVHLAVMDRFLADLEIVDLGRFNPAWIEFLVELLRSNVLAAAVFAGISLGQAHIDNQARVEALHAQAQLAQAQTELEKVKQRELQDQNAAFRQQLLAPNISSPQKDKIIEGYNNAVSEIVKKNALPSLSTDTPQSRVNIYPGDDQTREMVRGKPPDAAKRRPLRAVDMINRRPARSK